MADGVLKLFLSAAINFHQIGFMRTSKIQNDHIRGPKMADGFRKKYILTVLVPAINFHNIGFVILALIL